MIQLNLTKLKQAMMGQMDRTNVTSNNLANINTSGFKRDEIFFHTLSEELDLSEDITQSVDFSQGQLRETGNPLDIAISGRGFFSVETENGDVAYTREGSLHVDGDGTLRNQSGLPVLGEGGWINVLTEFGAPSEISITEKGEVYGDGALMDRIVVVDFEGKNALRKLGGNLFSKNEEALEFQVEDAQVKQGFLESSNVNPANEMIELIEIQREFESMQKMVRALDDVYRQAVSQVGEYR